MQPDDSELMRQFRAGKKEAFDTLMTRHLPGLIRAILRFAESLEHAQDLAQEAFVILYRNPERYEDRGKLGAYLHAVALNLRFMELRRYKNWQELAPWLAK